MEWYVRVVPAPVHFGLKVACQDVTVDQMRESWTIADEAGFDHLWLFDHLAGVKGHPEHAIFESWTLLAAMARATQRIRIGCLVTGNTYRHPAVLAKTAVTVDHLSGGRLEFGIGAAHAPQEHAMYGIEGLDHRIGRLSESLQVMKMLWTQDRSSFEGRYYTLKDAVANPKPVQRPRPPIWIGGRGESMLRLIARQADVWNVTVSGAADPEADVESAVALGRRLDELCREEGRTVRWSGQVFWNGMDPSVLERDVQRYATRGFTEIIVFPDVRASGRDLVAAVRAAAARLPSMRRSAAPS